MFFFPKSTFVNELIQGKKKARNNNDSLFCFQKLHLSLKMQMDAVVSHNLLDYLAMPISSLSKMLLYCIIQYQQL